MTLVLGLSLTNNLVFRRTSSAPERSVSRSSTNNRKKPRTAKNLGRKSKPPISDQDFFEKDIALQFLRPSSHKVLLRPQPPPTPHHAKYLIEIPVNQGTKTRRSRSLRNTLTPDMSQSRRNSRYIVSYDGNQKTTEKEKENKTIDARLNLTSREDQSIKSNPVKGSSKVENRVDSSKIDDTTNKQSRNKSSDKQHLSQPQSSQASSSAQMRRPSMIAKSKDKQLSSKNGNEGKKPEEHGQGAVASGKTDEPSKLGSNPAIKNNTAKPQSDDSSGKTERRDSNKKEAESDKKKGGSDEQSANENRRDSHKSETASSEVSRSGKVVDRSESTEGEQKLKDGDTPEGDLDRCQTPESLDSEGEFVEETEEEKLVDQRLIRLLSGRLDNLPPIACKVVRIFTSSTFTDTTLERNCLMENVYPKLKEYCRESYGLDFQVVDMRWGVRDEATDDHMTTDLCMNEIDNCQRLSLGPNFCVFLGQKYGYRPIPTIILGTELDMLREVIKEFYPEDAILVDKWYKLDENAVPPVYVLQPISSILVNFNNKRTQKLMEQDQNTWWNIMGKLQVMLRKGALELFISRKMNREEMHNYVMSVTEREVRRGIINAQDVDKHCLAYFRQIDQINLTAVRVARNFIDMIGKDVDEEAEYLLSILRDEHVPTKLAETNIVRFTVEWTGDNGLDFETHAEYLRQFCEIFYRDITDLVDKGMKEAINYGIYNLLFAEVLHHSHSCVTLCKCFKGRDEVLEATKSYVTGESIQPLIYWGEGGCGKTSLVAKGFSLVESWFPESTDPLTILRFLGTSPDSSSLIPLLTSLCRQIYFFYNHTYDNNIPSELTPLVTYLRSLLSLATTNQPIILFLDSIDQLSSANGAHQLTWFPLELPPNCKLVVSVVSDYFGILDRLRKVFPTSNNFINIPSLGQELGTIVIKAMLANANRTVSESQWYIVRQAIEGCSVPLYIKMVFGEMTRWRSYHSRYLTTLALNIHDSIIKLFERIENQHGRVLVSHAFGYVTLSKGGITETELEDLISLDEKVLNDVYQYHLPPVRRIPPLLWTRIRNDLSHYFTEREADGVNVINWYHRQFKEVSRERYFRNLNVLADTHSLMADYFLGIWGGVSKPFEYTELQCQRFGLDTAAGTCDRKVPEQPLCYADKLGKVTRYNLRKLSEQPYHLVRSHRYDDLHKKVLFNFRWLHAKLTCMPLQSILEDFEDALSFQADPIVKLMMDALRLSASVISRNPDMLAAQIVGRLIPYYDSQERIRDLIQQCDTDGVLVNALIPSHHCLHTPGGPLEYSLEGHPFAPFGVSVTSDGHYLVSASSKFIVWDLMTGESVRQMNPGVKGIMRQLTMTSDDSKAITYSNNNQVIICTVRTGDIKLIEDVAVGKDEIVNMTLNSSKFLIWSAKDWFVFSLDGNPIDTGSLTIKDSTIVHIYLGDGDDRYLIWKTGNSNGVDSNIEMTLAVSSGLGPSPDGDRLQFHSAVAQTKKKRTVYACADPETMDVVRFDRNREGSGWNRKWAFENEEKIYSLLFSSDETLLVAILPFAYKKWNLEGSEKTDTEAIVMALPKGARNFPYKTCLRHVVVFTKDNEYLVSAVRKIIYIFRVETGALLKTLDVHFGRIISLTAVTGGMNKIISASIDKTIKVWNMENITENVHPISRQEKSIEKVASCCTPERSLAVTTTRNCVGIWNMETGRLMTTLASSKLSSIVTHSVVTSDAKYIVSAESGVINIWNIETERLLKSDNSCLSDVQQMTLTSEDTKLIVVRRNNDDKNKAICECHKIPSGGLLYRFEYTIRTIKEFVVTSDGVHMVHVGVNTKNIEVLIVHVVESGCFVTNSRPKYSRFRDFQRIVAMPTHPNRVAIIDDEKGNIWDWKKKSLVRSIPKWNGMCTKDGKYGLYAPNRGGLDLLDLKTGTKLSTLIPRIAEGVFSIRVMFTANDQHVIYYHSGQRSIRVFRVPDGTKIADYKCHAEITDLTSGHDGRSLVLGAIDGSLVVLIIADSSIDSNLEFLKSMHDPSSKSVSEEPVEEDEIAII